MIAFRGSFSIHLKLQERNNCSEPLARHTDLFAADAAHVGHREQWRVLNGYLPDMNHAYTLQNMPKGF